MATPDTAVVGVLNTAVGALTTGTNLFSGPIRAVDVDSIPVKAVFCLSSGGVEPLDYLQGGSHSPQDYTFVVTIYVRSDGQDYAGGLSLARSCGAAIHDSPPSGYYSARITESDPMYVGQDQNGSHLFAHNVRLHIEE